MGSRFVEIEQRRMIVIGIETSGLHGSISLRKGGRRLEFKSLDQVGRRHAQSLVLELRDILQAHDIQPRDVDAVAVSRGPGSFTGLRVGVVCAKTFAYATGCRFVSVDTFAAVAMNCADDIKDVWVLEDAQRGEVFAGRYRRATAKAEAADVWQLQDSIAIVDAESWLKSRSADETLIGRGLQRLDASQTAARCLQDDETCHPGAHRIGERAEWMFEHSAACEPVDFDLWKAVPFYVRRSAAEEKRDELAAGGSQAPIST